MPEKLSLSEEFIEEAVLLNLDVIKFDENGGQYAKPRDCIVGKLKDEKKVEIPLDQIKEFRISTVEPINIKDLKN